MAKSPTRKNNRHKPMEGLNLTPFIDMITCLMFFLMMFAGVIPVVMIDAPLPKVASTAEEVKKAKEEDNKLDLTLYINASGFVVKTAGAGDKTFMLANGAYPYEELHKHLLGIKSKRPKVHEITLMPSDDVTYDVMVQVMDASREMRKGDEGFQSVPPDISQKPESAQFNRLFPEVSIGGV